ncbi:MAG: hypothetical protein H0V01_05365 [Bacteroidetes bacterium]|nr:hypothetical protein [Bacteroidota bacterium]HET6243651.1 hypothetical protein [Bacteroidia bacterium]
MKLGISIALSLSILVLGYFVYDSINSRIKFEKETTRRNKVVEERLKDIRTAQLAYKNQKGEYTNNFDSLISFVKYDKMPIIMQIGDAEDSIAVASGQVIRDTTYINIIDTLFSQTRMLNRLRPFYLDSISYVPFSNGEKFDLDAGEIEKNKVKVKVFEVFATYKKIYTGLETKKQNVKVHEGLRVGSMTEPSTSGNWE